MAFSANVDAALNQRREENYEDAVYRASPALGLMTKGDSNKSGGSVIKVTVKTGYSPGKGANYAAALALTGETQRKAFLVTPSTLYHMEFVDHDAALYTMGDDNAVVDQLSDAEKSCMSGAATQLDQALFSDGYGTLFTILSFTGTTGAVTFTATSPSDVFRIIPGDTLVTKATPAAGTLDTGTVLVTAVDPGTGLVSGTAQAGYNATGTTGKVAGLSATMAASTSLVTFPGFKAWLTDDSTALAASFYGVVRASDRFGLAGHVIDCTGGIDVISAINKVLQSISNYPGANPDLVFCSSGNYEKLMSTLDSRAEYTSSKGQDIDVLYDGVSFMSATGKRVTVHVASACSSTDIFVLDSSTWHFKSPKNKMVIPGQLDGTAIIPLATADSTMVKYKATGFLYCHIPAFNGRAKVLA